MKKISLMFMLLFVQTCMADVVPKDSVIKPEVEKSLSTYKVCNVQELAQALGKQFNVFYMTDSLAKYNYYLIRNSSAMNADELRKQTCDYILKNNCYLFWGNVANIAMIAEQKAAWFPADTSPHYMLSPIMTCNQLHQPKANKS